MADALSLAVGDRVVYPNQGLCKVTGIETRDIAGQKLSFITLIREEDGSKVMVPEAKVVAIGVRKVANLDEVNRVFAFLKSDSDKASLDWKARARSNVELMATGGLMGLATVVKGLQVLSELRPLPTKERGLYDDARHLLVTELAASLKIPEADAEDTIDVVLFVPGKERPKRLAEEFKVADLEVTAPAAEPIAAAAPRKRGRPPKPKPLITEPPPPPKKRGRPPKPKPLVTEPPPPPKKRGRPPKAKPEAAHGHAHAHAHPKKKK
jgi:RNA polymerase-interacting CarD/CdnL/TRCF family regulator